MSTSFGRPPGYLKQLWFRWKRLKLPWRTKWLVGSDLSGNTFWEFKDALNANRLRRIVQYNRRVHYSDVKITPQWHQWLRHTRDEAPSISEQQLDVARQVRLKQLAAAADQRWASKPSLLDPPEMQHPTPALEPRDPGGYAPQTEPDAKEGVRNAVGSPVEVQGNLEGQDTDKGRFKGEAKEGAKEDKENPWKTARGGLSEDWQPAAWSPGSAKRR